MGFAEQFSTFTIKVGQLSEEKCRAIAARVGTELVAETPVAKPTPEPIQVDDPGQAKGNWQATIGSPANTPIDHQDESGEATISAIKNTIREWKPNSGSSLWITNCVPYIPVLEYGLYPNPPAKGTGRTSGGYSTQAVGGMVGKAVAGFDNIANGFTEEAI